jgi:hypothetical protein
MLLRLIFGALGSAELQPCRHVSLWNRDVEQGNTNVRVRGAFSIADGVGWGANTPITVFDKAVCTRVVTGVPRGAFGGSMLGIRTVGTPAFDLEKTP